MFFLAKWRTFQPLKNRKDVALRQIVLKAWLPPVSLLFQENACPGLGALRSGSFGANPISPWGNGGI